MQPPRKGEGGCLLFVNSYMHCRIAFPFRGFFMRNLHNFASFVDVMIDGDWTKLIQKIYNIFSTEGVLYSMYIVCTSNVYNTIRRHEYCTLSKNE